MKIVDVHKMKVEILESYDVIISELLDKKINWFLSNHNYEINGWLIGKITNEGVYIEDILIPRQKVTGTSTDTEDNALVELRKEYGDKCKEIIGHWHSHCSMGCFWSGTDDSFIEDYMETRRVGVFMVSSKREGHKIRLELRDLIKMSLDEVDYDIERDFNGIGENMKDIIDKKVTVEKVENRCCKWGYNDVYNDYSNYMIESEPDVFINNNQLIIKNADMEYVDRVEEVLGKDYNAYNTSMGTVTMIYNYRNYSEAEQAKAMLIQDFGGYDDEFSETETNI